MSSSHTLAPSLGAVEDLAGAGAQQALGYEGSGRCRLAGVAVYPVADPLAAVGETHEGLYLDPQAVDPGVDADRRRAGRLEQGDGGTLGGQLAQRRLVAHLCGRLNVVRVLDAHLQG